MLWKAITPRVHGDVVVIDLDGKTGLGDDDALFAYVVTLLEQGFLKFVLNFVKVPHIDSMTLGETVRSYTAVARRGGRLVLLHLHVRIQAVLDKEGLTRIIEVFDAEEAALRSFGETSAASAATIEPRPWHNPRSGAGRGRD